MKSTYALQAERLESRLILAVLPHTNYGITFHDPNDWANTITSSVTFNWDLTDPVYDTALTGKTEVDAAAGDVQSAVQSAWVNSDTIYIDGVVSAVDTSYATNDQFFSWIADAGLSANQQYYDPSAGVKIDKTVNDKASAITRVNALFGEINVMANSNKNMAAAIKDPSNSVLDSVALSIKYGPYVRMNSYRLKEITAELNLIKTAYFNNP